MPDAEDRTTVADVNDDENVVQATAGMDAIIYLAMGVSKETASCEEVKPAFDVNVQGLYRFLCHAFKGGAKRFVYASTLSVYRHLWESLPLDETKPADEWQTYGLSKRVGEFICEAAAQEYPDRTVIALRLKAPRNEEQWDASATHNHCYLGPKDSGRLFAAAARFDKPGYYMTQATGDMEGKYHPNTRAFELLGWSPKNE